MVRNVGPAYSSEVNCVEFLELVQAVGGHVPASLQEVLGRPVEGGKFKLEATKRLCQYVEHLNGSICDVDADAVARDAGNAVDFADFADVGWHGGLYQSLCNSWRGCAVYVSVYAEQWSVT